MRRLLFLGIVSFVGNLPVFAGCPSNYVRLKKYESTEAYLKWLDESKGAYLKWVDDSSRGNHKCLSMDYPEMNNARGRYAIGYGSSDYRCGNIVLRKADFNSSILQVKTSDPSVPYVQFRNATIGYPEYLEQKCEEEGNIVRCYAETRSSKIYIPDYGYEGVNKKMVLLFRNLQVDECKTISL